MWTLILPLYCLISGTFGGMREYGVCFQRWMNNPIKCFLKTDKIFYFNPFKFQNPSPSQDYEDYDYEDPDNDDFEEFEQ